MRVTDVIFFCYVLCGACISCSVFAAQPLPTYSGYLSTNKSDGSELFYAYYEAREALDQASTAPTLLWLQAWSDLQYPV